MESVKCKGVPFLFSLLFQSFLWMNWWNSLTHSLTRSLARSLHSQRKSRTLIFFFFPFFAFNVGTRIELEYTVFYCYYICVFTNNLIIKNIWKAKHFLFNIYTYIYIPTNFFNSSWKKRKEISLFGGRCINITYS